MKITGYKILTILGMLILHSLPFLAYIYCKTQFNKLIITLITILLNIAIIGISGIYENLFKKIDKQMKKEIKLW